MVSVLQVYCRQMWILTFLSFFFLSFFVFVSCVSNSIIIPVCRNVYWAQQAFVERERMKMKRALDQQTKYRRKVDLLQQGGSALGGGSSSSSSSSSSGGGGSVAADLSSNPPPNTMEDEEDEDEDDLGRNSPPQILTLEDLQKLLATEQKFIVKCSRALKNMNYKLKDADDGQLTIWELHGYSQLVELCRSLLGQEGVAPKPPPAKLQLVKPRGRDREPGEEVKKGKEGKEANEAKEIKRDRVKARSMDLSNANQDKDSLPLLLVDRDQQPIPLFVGNVLELLRHVERNLWFQRAHLRAKHGLPVHEDERKDIDEADIAFQQVHPESSKYQFVWSRQGIPIGMPNIAVDRGELCRCHLRRCTCDCCTCTANEPHGRRLTLFYLFLFCVVLQVWCAAIAQRGTVFALGDRWIPLLPIPCHATSGSEASRTKATRRRKTFVQP